MVVAFLFVAIAHSIASHRFTIEDDAIRCDANGTHENP